MTKKVVKNILIFPGGSEIAAEICNALKYVKGIHLIGGSSVKDHCQFMYQDYTTKFPFITDEKFIPFLNHFIQENNIDYIYPALDMVQVFLTEHQEEITAKIVTSSKETVSICRSKKRTYEYLKKEKFVPKTYLKSEEIKTFPVFIKPAIGQGSYGTKIVKDKKELDYILSTKDEDIVICEYLEGTEYTVDCFTDRKGKLRISHMRSRDRIKAGISVRSTKCSLPPEVRKMAEIINSYFNFNGAWFFQIKKNYLGEYKLMEISPRIPGTMGLSRNLGINFPLLTLYNMWGIDVEIIENEYATVLDRAFISCYQIDYSYNHVYIDFDDTITKNGKLNLDVIKYLYQLVNQEKKIYLLTRHGSNINQTLAHYKLAPSLFHEIIEVDENELKSTYIKHKDAIFIDDSFRERKDVHEKCKIPVFDVDMVESLLDWKV